ncbi:MAG: hypothetical protein IJL99_01030 [Firmicutes bacterium]|nr:hypothetical protein [Bacillota bacterium]
MFTCTRIKQDIIVVAIVPSTEIIYIPISIIVKLVEEFTFVEISISAIVVHI